MAAHAAASIPAKQVNIMLGHPDGDSEADRYVTESQRQFMNRTDTHPGALSPRAPVRPQGGNIPQGTDTTDFTTEASQNYMQKPTSYNPWEREAMKRRMQSANFSFGDEKPVMQSSTGSNFQGAPMAQPSEEEQRQQRERRQDLRKPHFAFGRDAAEYGTSNAQRAHPPGAGRADPVDTADLRKAHFELGHQAAEYESSYQDHIRHAVAQPEGASMRLADEDVVLARQRARLSEDMPTRTDGKSQSALARPSRVSASEQYVTEYGLGVGVSASPQEVTAASEERVRWASKGASMRSAKWSLGSERLDYATSGQQWGTAQRGVIIPAEAVKQPPVSVDLGHDSTQYATSYGSSYAVPHAQTKASPATSARTVSVEIGGGDFAPQQPPLSTANACYASPSPDANTFLSRGERQARAQALRQSTLSFGRDDDPSQRYQRSNVLPKYTAAQQAGARQAAIRPTDACDGMKRDPRAQLAPEEQRYIARRAKAEADRSRRKGTDQGYMQRLAKEFRIRIPLQPQDEPQDLPPNIDSSIQEEYAAKYLQRIGADPTPENMRLVLRQKPIQSCSVSTAWRSRGWVTDTIFVAPYASSGGGSARAVSRRTEAPPEPDAGEEEEEEAGAKGMLDAELEEGEAERAAPQSFEHMRARFVYPFNVPERRERRRRRPAGGSSPRAAGEPQLRSTVPTPPAQRARARMQHEGGRSLGAKLEGPAGVDLAAEELQRPLQVTVEEIEALQKHFMRTFPFSGLAEKLSASDIRALGRFLITTPVLRVIGLLCHYLHWVELAGPYNGKHLSREEREQLFIAVAETWAVIHAQCSEQRSRVVHFLPLVILSVRAAVEMVFADAYPVFFAPSHPPGQRALRAIDFRALSILDPGGFASRIPNLESTAEGLRRVSRAPRAGRAAPRYYGVSALVREAVPVSSYAPARAQQRRASIRRGMREGTVAPPSHGHRAPRPRPPAGTGVGASERRGAGADSGSAAGTAPGRLRSRESARTPRVPPLPSADRPGPRRPPASWSRPRSGRTVGARSAPRPAQAGLPLSARRAPRGEEEEGAGKDGGSLPRLTADSRQHLYKAALERLKAQYGRNKVLQAKHGGVEAIFG